MSPVRTPRPRAAARGTRSLEEMSGDRLTIRVVEEAPAYRRGLEEAFTAAGHRVAEEDDAPELVLVALRVAADGGRLGAAGGRPGHGGDPHAERPRVDEEETEWLEELAQGSTVVSLADAYGYSERVMFRRLHDLYGRLGAANRSEALINAGRLGLPRGE